MILFPPVESADEDGFLCWGGDLTPETLRTAYTGGIFPWPMRGYPLLWFAPPRRALLFLDEFHSSRSLQKLLHKPWQVRFDGDFRGVMTACAKAPRPGQRGTWITKPMIEAYSRLHQLGIAHSVEVYWENELAGGLYGVNFGEFFAGESMFFRESGASKVAVWHLVQHLKSQGATWLDCQTMTPLFESFGARDVPRDEFMQLLNEATAKPNLEWP